MRMGHSRPLAIALLCALLASATAAAQTPCSSSAGTACRGRITLDSGWKVPYWRTYALGTSATSNARVTRAIIVIHGTDRNPDDYFGHVVAAARQEQALDATLIMAPHFQTDEDDPAGDEVFWTSGGWKQGDRSVNGGGVSAYAVLDQVIERLGDRSGFPNLRQIVITGHSAGGQFTSRYAAGSRVQNPLTRHAFRYVIANPSSYMYLRQERPVLSDPGGNDFRVPATACRFNDYRYGLDARNAYMNAVSASSLQSQYRTREVIYLLGSDDIYDSNDLDVTCAANFQGFNRFERGNWFFAFMNRFFPTASHTLRVVPDVGHSGREMYTSEEGRLALFR